MPRSVLSGTRDFASGRRSRRRRRRARDEEDTEKRHFLSHPRVAEEGDRFVKAWKQPPIGDRRWVDGDGWGRGSRGKSSETTILLAAWKNRAQRRSASTVQSHQRVCLGFEILYLYAFVEEGEFLFLENKQIMIQVIFETELYTYTLSRWMGRVRFNPSYVKARSRDERVKMLMERGKNIFRNNSEGTVRQTVILTDRVINIQRDLLCFHNAANFRFLSVKFTRNGQEERSTRPVISISIIACNFS